MRVGVSVAVDVGVAVGVEVGVGDGVIVAEAVLLADGVAVAVLVAVGVAVAVLVAVGDGVSVHTVVGVVDPPALSSIFAAKPSRLPRSPVCSAPAVVGKFAERV